MYFSDSVAYLTYVDNLYFYRSEDWFIFEPVSKIFFIVLRDITKSTEVTVAAGHYFISAVYIFGSLLIFPPREGNWRGLLMAFALYGPQLAFVTIRATPAYFIASLAVMHAIKGNNRAFLYTIVATSFHISASLALLPIVALLSKNKLTSLAALQRPKVLLTVLVIIGAVFIVAGNLIFSAAQQIFSYIPFLGKYLVFAVGLSDNAGVSNVVTTYAIGHFILLAAITAFSFLFITIRNPVTRSVGIFVIVSYILYFFAFVAFSPIAAFRQTPFWMLPAFSLFPWQRIGWRGIGQAPFLALVAGIFIFQFGRVI